MPINWPKKLTDVEITAARRQLDKLEAQNAREAACGVCPGIEQFLLVDDDECKGAIVMCTHCGRNIELDAIGGK